MGTRSRIAIANDDGSFTSIYCHWDGDPAGVGATLRDHYGPVERVRRLIGLGDISSLGPEIGEKHKFGNGPKDWTDAYGRDRGEDGVKAVTSANLAELSQLTRDCGGEWLYVYGKDETWRVAKGGVAYFGLPADKLPGELQNLADYIVEKAA